MRLPKLDNRVVWLDVVRAMAIWMVVLVHVSGNPWVEPSMPLPFYVLNSVIKGFSYLGVPLFFMLSGMLVLDTHDTVLKFYAKRLFRIVRPWMFYSAISLLYINILLLISGQTLYFPDLHELIYVQYWFVPVIFMLYVITPLLRWIVSNVPHGLDVVLMFSMLLYSFTPTVRALMGLEVGELYYGIYFLNYLPYYLLGARLKHLRFQTSFLLFFTLILLIGQSLLLTHLRTIGIDDQRTIYLNPLTIAAAVLLFLLIKSLQQSLKNIPSTYRQLIQLVSYYSFGIYLLHQTIHKLMRFSFFDSEFLGYVLPTPLDWLFYSVVLLLLSFVGVLLLDQIPYLKKWTR